MRLLLDTHTPISWLSTPPIAAKRGLISDPSNLVFVLTATTWEIAVKQALSRLPAPDYRESAATEGRLEPPPIQFDHALTFALLPAPTVRAH